MHTRAGKSSGHGYLFTLRACALPALVFGVLLTVLADTAGAGLVWLRQAPPTTNTLNAVAFAGSGSAHACAVGGAGTIVTTSDGGVTWTTRSSGTDQLLNAVTFMDADRGVAVGGSATVLFTHDGGLTWGGWELSIPGTFTSVSFPDREHGWIVGSYGNILVTGNGGVDWYEQTSPTDGTLNDVTFIDARQGWAVGSSGTILATQDGGATWLAQTSNTTAGLSSVTFIDSSHGWAVGSSGTILMTANGGADWVVRASGTTSGLDDVVFTDAQHGWAVGIGAILRSVDGGVTWTSLPQIHDVLRGVAFADAGHGCAVGTSGRVLTCREYAPPVVTISGVDSRWHRSPVKVAAMATVDPGLTILSVQYRVNSGGWMNLPWSAPAWAVTLSSSGTYNVSVKATDSGGQQGSASTTVKIDRARPIVKARKAVARAGKAAGLRIYVSKKPAGCGRARVTVKFLKGTRVVKRVRTAYLPVNTWVRAQWRCTLPKGSYELKLYAKDAIGNTQAMTGTASLVVR